MKAPPPHSYSLRRNMRAITFSEPSSQEVDFSASRIRIAVIMAISIGVIVPAVFWGIPSSRDLDNHFRFALPFFDALAHGHWYPGWLAESNGGYGDPSFRFYPPAVYYVMAAMRWLTGSWYQASLLTFCLLSALAGVGMYFWARSIFSATTAMWAAIFYSLAPYHLNQLYQSFLLAEYAAAAILPFAFGFVERVCQKRRWSYVAGLGAVYALLLLTHLPLTIIGSFALLAYAGLRIEKTHILETLKKLSVAFVLGFAASACYWVTMIAELRWIAINHVEVDSSVDYRTNFLFSTFSPANLNVWWMNILTVMTLLMIAPAAILIFHRLNSRAVKAIVGLSLFTFFMASPLSYPVWKVLPPLQQTQFPWRWLALFSMAASMLAAAAVPVWISQRQRVNRAMVLLVFGLVFIGLSFTLSHVVREAMYLKASQFDSNLAHIRGSESVNYWIPIWARLRPQPMQSQIEASDRLVTVRSWQPERRSFDIAEGSATEARVKTFYYPHWIATSGEQVLRTRPASDGALLISLPQQAATVNLDFREPPRTRIAAGISALGWLSIGAFAIPWRRRKR